MSHTSFDALYDEVTDILPSLTANQAKELNRLVDNNDLQEARWYLSFLAKQYIPEAVYKQAAVEDAERLLDNDTF